MAEEGEEVVGPEERRGLLLLAATHGRADVAVNSLEDERKDPQGDVEALLRAVGAEDAARDTPMHLACRHGHIDLVRLLLSRGADPGARNAAGHTAYALAKGAKFERAVRAAFESDFIRRAATGEVEGVEQLLTAGVDPKFDQGGKRPSQWAETFGHAELAARLSAAEEGRPYKPAAAAPAAVAAPPQAPAAEAAAQAGAGQADAEAEADRLELGDLDDLPGGPPLFPLLWPQVCLARPLGPRDGMPRQPPRERSDGEPKVNPVALPLAADRTLRVELPADLAPEHSGALLALLEEALQVAAARSAAAAAEVSGHRFHLAAPLLVPCFLPSAADRLWEAAAEENGDCDDELGRAAISLALDARLGLAPGALRVSLAPGAAGGLGRVEVAGADLSALRAGLRVLLQLLRHEAGVDALSRRLTLPAALLEDGLPQAGAREPCGVYLDACALPEAGAAEALAQLHSWRVGRIYVPVKLCRDAPRRERQLRRLFQLRCCCAAAGGAELVPVLLAPSGPGAALAASPAERRALVQLLAQFGQQGLVGLRCLPGALGAGAKAAAQLRALLAELHTLSAAALGPRGPVLAVWLPAQDAGAAEALCALARSGDRAGRAPRLWAVLESSASGGSAGGSAGGLVATAAAVSARGVPCMVFAAAEACAGEHSSLALTRVPSVVWPGAGVRAKAESLQELYQRSCVGSARGLVVEVPVWTAPWLAPAATQPPPSQGMWCALTGFLAAGLAHAAGEGGGAATSALGLPQEAPSDQHLVDGLLSPETGERPGAPRQLGQDNLGPLLVAQLLGGASPGPANSNAILLAGALWDHCGTLAPSPIPPPELLGSILDLMVGHWESPAPSSSAEVLAGVSLWHQHLYKRRHFLRLAGGNRWLSSGSGPTWAEAARPLLHVALCGLEWLVFAAHLLILLLKHALPAGGSPSAQSRDLRWALSRVPPAKLCDVQNTFLKVVDCTIGRRDVAAPGQPPPLPGTGGAQDFLGSDGGSEAGMMDPEVLADYQALWHSGLRLGASLQLEPWVGFKEDG